jgi:hypothetical protein
VVGDMTLLVPMAGPHRPGRRNWPACKRKQEKNAQEITRARAKLDNRTSCECAAEVVTTERERIAQFEKVNGSLARQIEIVSGSLRH